MHVPEGIFTQAAALLESHSLRIASADYHRPWGGFLVVDPRDSAQFERIFFPQYARRHPRLSVSAKLLIVTPGKRLSWQYHDRRSEQWVLLEGDAGFFTSPTDDHPLDQQLFPPKNKPVSISLGQRHRIVGGTQPSIIGEIWIHSDPAHPSDEHDNHRLQDDTHRT
jgi:mannose-6-phosphate isomerase